MSAIKVKPDHFSGTGHVHGRGPDHLAAIVRGLAIDNARLKVEAASVKDFTDSSTGVAGAMAVVAVGARGPIDATSAGGASASALTTSLGKLQDAGKVIAGTINEASALLGLPASSSASGNIAVADTIPAVDKAGTAATGNAAAKFSSAVAALEVAAGNLNALIYGANAVLAAVGAAKLPTCGPHGTPGGLALATIPAVTAVAAGPGAITKADVDAFLVAYANNIATLAAAWNASMNQSAPGALHVVAG